MNSNGFFNMFIPSSRRQIQYYDILFAQSDKNTIRQVNLRGNKIILPQSTIYQISGYLQSNNASPMIFCISNQVTNKSTYVSVLEFTAEEKKCIVPDWLFEFLQLEINPEVHIAFTTGLPKASFLKFQPHETLFIEQTYHPKTLLEVALRDYLCLHVGDTIQIEDYNKKIFKLDVLEIKPNNDYKAAILLDADIDFDLAPPLDYDQMKELKMKKQSSSVIVQSEEEKQQTGNGPAFFSGKGIVIDEKQQTSKQQWQNKEAKKEEYDPRKFKLTHGVKTTQMLFSGNNVKVDDQYEYGKTKKR